MSFVPWRPFPLPQGGRSESAGACKACTQFCFNRLMNTFMPIIQKPFTMDSNAHIDNDLLEQCRELSSSIINRAAWRTIRNINKAMESTAIDERLARLGMSIFDQISIYFHTRPFRDIVFGFEEYLNENIHGEMEKLPETERIILRFRDLSALSQREADALVFMDIKEEIANILSLHYSSSRIQRFVNRYNLHG